MKEINNVSNDNDSKNYNYLKISGNNNIINYNINNNDDWNANNIFNNSFKNNNNIFTDHNNDNNNYCEEKKNNRSTSDLSSSSLSNHTLININMSKNSSINYTNNNNNNNVSDNSFNNTEERRKEKQKAQKKRIGKKKDEKQKEQNGEDEEDEEEEDILFNNNNLFGIENEEEKRSMDDMQEKYNEETSHILQNEIIDINGTSENDISNENENELIMKDLFNNNEKSNNKSDKKENEEYEKITNISKDIIEVRPYDEFIEENKNIENDGENEYLKDVVDVEIFDSDLLNNIQNEFLSFDFYNIQRKLRQYCSLRFQDDEIFNGNKDFFNKFN